MENDRSFANPYRHLGDLYRVCHSDYEMALQCYNRSLKLRPKYREAEIGIEIVHKLQNGTMKPSEDYSGLSKHLSQKEKDSLATQNSSEDQKQDSPS